MKLIPPPSAAFILELRFKLSLNTTRWKVAAPPLTSIPTPLVVLNDAILLPADGQVGDD